jgi:outer membrane receptor protein involved in Fe transport
LNFSLAENENKSVTIELSERMNSLDVAVVSAGKFEQKLEEVTVSMEIIQPKLIENKNTTSIEDVLQQASGVVIVDSEPQIRSGSGFSFGAGSRVMIMVDDLPLVSGDAGRPSWGFFAVENIEQIEIIKGAASVLYGSGALNGVINIRTAYPRSTPKTKLTLFHGFYSDPQTKEAKYWERTPLISGANFLHSKQFGNLDVVLGVSLLVDESYKGPYLDTTRAYSPFDPQRADANSRARANLNLRYRSKKVPGLSYGVNTNWLIGSSVSTLLWENTGNGLYAPYDGSATKTNQVVGNLDPFITYVTPDGQTHSVKTRWHNLDNDNDTRSAENPEGGANQDNYSDFYYSEYQYQRNFDSLGIKNFNLTAGIMSMFTFSEAQLYAGENPDGKNEASNLATYLQLDKKVGNRLNLSAGIRYESFKINSQEQSKPVFRSGVSYKLGQGTFARASYGQGFRFPTIAEKFITTSVGGVVIFPNLDLKPETSENIEIGLKQGFKIGRFLGYLDAAVFRQKYTNFIEFTFGIWGTGDALVDQLGFRSLNTGDSQVTGIEISGLGKGKFGPVEIQFLGGYTYTEPISLSPDYVYGESPREGTTFSTSYNTTSSNNSGNILKYRFKHLVRFDTEASYKKLSLGVSARYNSKTENVDLAFVDLDRQGLLPTGIDYWLEERNNGDVIFDARIAYKITPKIRGSLIVNNLLNREYALRPLSIESPRLTTLQLALDL